MRTQSNYYENKVLSANSIYLGGSTDAVLTARDGELSDYITVRRSNNAFLNMEIGRTIL